MRLLASAPIPHPLIVCSSYVHASGHAGLIGSAGSEVIFVLLFNPRPPPCIAAIPPTSTLVDASAAAGFHDSSRVVLIQCSFQTNPTRLYALGSADRIILYGESGGCVYSYTHSVAPIRAQAFDRPVGADTLIIPAPAPHEDAFLQGEQGTPGAPHIQKMSVMLRKPAPAWLEYGEGWVEEVARRDAARQAEQEGALATEVHRICAMSMTIDAETSNLDAFRGLVVGTHVVDAGRRSVAAVPSSSEGEATAGTSASTMTPRPHQVPDSYSSSSPPATPSSFDPPSPISASPSSPVTLLNPVAPPLLLLPPPPRQPTRYRRECRVRYKRTIFPARLECTWHELAALGTHGHRAIWIEGDGPPPEEDGLPDVLPTTIRDESASLRVMLTSVEGSGAAPKQVIVPLSVRAQLSRVSCVAFEDSVGILALATLDGRVMLLEFV
jgi:hypothetical protein